MLYIRKISCLALVLICLIGNSAFQCNNSKDNQSSDEKEKQVNREVKPEKTDSSNPDNKKTQMEPKFEEIELGCLDWKLLDQEMIIKSDLEYEQLKKKRVPAAPDCKNYNFPVIDFKNKTLLGYKTMVSGCKEPKYIRTVHCDNGVEICQYNIRIIQYGLCEKAWNNMNWIIADKLPETNSIEFKKEVLKKE